MSKLKKIISSILGDKVYIKLVNRKNLVLKYLKTFFYLFFLNLFFLKKRIEYQKKLKTIRIIPVRQLVALDILLEIKNLFKNLGISFFLLHGTLLGAVRQESFAGRPNDIDLGIKKEDFDKLLNSLNLLENKFKDDLKLIDEKDFKDGKIIKDKFVLKNRKFYFIIKNLLIDFSIYSPVNKPDGIVWEGETLKKHYNNFSGTVSFKYEDLNNFNLVKLFENNFFCPKNINDYLIKFYGANWKIPIKKQFCWKIIN